MVNQPKRTKILELVGQAKRLNAAHRYEEALIALNKAIELDPESSFAYGTKGDVLRQQGRYKDALVVLDKAIELNPEYSFA